MRPTGSICSTTRSRPFAYLTRRPALGREDRRLRALAAREFPLTVEGYQQLRRFRVRFPGDLTRMSVYQDIAEGAPPPGVEYFLPLFFDSTTTWFDYLPSNTIIAADADVESYAAQAVPRSRRPLRSTMP